MEVKTCCLKSRHSGQSLFFIELVHHFGEDSWDGTSGEIKDSTSNGYDGVRVGDATTTSSGKIGRAGTFDGSGDYGSSGDATVSGNFTISFWALNDNALDEEASSWYGFPVYKASADFYMGWQSFNSFNRDSFNRDGPYFILDIVTHNS